MKKAELSKSDITGSRWIRASQGTDRYPWCHNTLMETARKAGAISRVGRMVMIDTIKLDAYLEAQAEGGEE